MSQFLDEGYVKFECEWIEQPLTVSVPNSLKIWRDKMHQLGLIGHYQKYNIGYGNISVRINEGILISGTQTGIFFPIKEEHFTLVTTYEIEKNKVVCRGPVKASSETMTHAAIYEADKTVHAIIHIHHMELWTQLLYKVPTTEKEIPYGTPEMAKEIKRLFSEDATLKEQKIIIMAGHEEGIISFGKDIEAAGNNLLNRFL